MCTKAIQPQHLIILFAVASILVGLWLLLEPGAAFLIVVGALPFMLVIGFVREQRICHTKQCMERHVRFKKQDVMHW